MTILPDLSFEKDLWKKGFNYIVGMDEVGRGSWAGPLVAAGVILPHKYKIPKGLADSKLVNKSLRRKLAKSILSDAVAVKIVEISNLQINKIGIGAATQTAFRKIIYSISSVPDFCLIDAFYVKYVAKKKQLPIKHGDVLCASISAASIVAKVYRDDLMRKLAEKFPLYGFEKHKGYGTMAHQMAIKKNGFCQIHRTSYNLRFLSQ
jgi:ribonuclease HII